MNYSLRFLLSILSTALTISYSNASHHSGSVRTIQEFPVGTWIENIAVRSNGNLLLTTATGPELHILDPLQPNTSVIVTTFPSALSTFGIAEYSHDTFAVATSNFSLTTGKVTPGSCAVWSVDMNGVEVSAKGELSGAPKVHKIVDVPEASLLNGMTGLPGSNDSVLIADVLAGVIYRVNARTSTYNIAINNTLTATDTLPIFGSAGANGLKIHNGELYLTNTGKRIFARLPIHPDGTPTGKNGTIISRPPAAISGFDDFALDAGTGEAFLVLSNANTVEEVNTRSGSGRIIAGNLNSTQIAEPTSAALGRGPTDKDVLYVVTGGGLLVPVNGNQTLGGQVVAVDLGKRY